MWSVLVAVQGEEYGRAAARAPVPLSPHCGLGAACDAKSVHKPTSRNIGLHSCFKCTPDFTLFSLAFVGKAMP